MKLKGIPVICLIWPCITILAQTAGFEPCLRVNHIVLDELDDTSWQHQMQQGGVACGRKTIIEGYWYRFESEHCSMMPVGYQSESNCKPGIAYTTLTKHSTEPGTRNMTVCAGLDGTSSRCFWSSVIQVKECRPAGGQGDNYYVYKLEGPGVCPRPYCTPAGQMCIWDSTFSSGAEPDSITKNVKTALTQGMQFNINIRGSFEPWTILMILISAAIGLFAVVKSCANKKERHTTDAPLLKA